MKEMFTNANWGILFVIQTKLFLLPLININTFLDKYIFPNLVIMIDIGMSVDK